MLQNVDLSEDTPDNVEAGLVAWAPGTSSEVAGCRVKAEGKWITLNGKGRATQAKIATIEKHSLNSKILLEKIAKIDAELAPLADFFLGGRGEVKLNTAGIDCALSKNITRKDVKMLRRCGLIKQHNAHYALSNFKVPKKNPKEARLITDCRKINSLIMFCNNMKMNLPELHCLMNWGIRYKRMWAMDANAYFFQFELKGPAEEWFPMRVQKEDGSVESYILTKLPMGLSLAPILAQRASNVIMTEVQREIDRLNIDGKVAAWVDNFMMFANSEEDLATMAGIMKRILAEVDIKCKEIDTTGEFLGLIKKEEGLGLNESFVTKVTQHIDEVQRQTNASKEQLEVLAGELMWINYSVGRKPLACFPHTIKLLRSIPTLTTDSAISKDLKDELRIWAHILKSTYKPTQPPMSTSKTAWSDATTQKIAVVIGNTVVIAQANAPIKIALMEAIAAGWSYLLAGKNANLHIDNQGVAYAFAKGHCASPAINTVISNTFNIHEPTHYGSITWVPTADQEADAATRDKLTFHDKIRTTGSQREAWKHINSWILISNTKENIGVSTCMSEKWHRLPRKEGGGGY